MRQDVQQVVRQCRVCDLSKARGTARPVELHPLPVKGLFYRWGVDLAGPLVETPEGYKYCMVAIEHFSKHIEVSTSRWSLRRSLRSCWSAASSITA